MPSRLSPGAQLDAARAALVKAMEIEAKMDEIQTRAAALVKAMKIEAKMDKALTRANARKLLATDARYRAACKVGLLELEQEVYKSAEQ